MPGSLTEVDVPQPWPKPVFAHEVLAEIDPILEASRLPTRTLAAVPPAGVNPPVKVTFNGPGRVDVPETFTQS